MLNEKAVFEIGNIIHVRRKWNFKQLSAQEILDSVEYQREFKGKYPEISKIVETDNMGYNKALRDVEKLIDEVWDERDEELNKMDVSNKIGELKQACMRLEKDDFRILLKQKITGEK